jgi:hypothetical protein
MNLDNGGRTPSSSSEVYNRRVVRLDDLAVLGAQMIKEEYGTITVDTAVNYTRRVKQSFRLTEQEAQLILSSILAIVRKM